MSLLKDTALKYQDQEKDIRDIIKEHNINIIEFDFNKKIRCMIKCVNWKWYLAYDKELDNYDYANFFLAREFGHILMILERKNWKLDHITAWDHNIDTWENNITNEQLIEAKKFEDFILSKKK